MLSAALEGPIGTCPLANNPSRRARQGQERSREHGAGGQVAAFPAPRRNLEFQMLLFSKQIGEGFDSQSLLMTVQGLSLWLRGSGVKGSSVPASPHPAHQGSGRCHQPGIDHWPRAVAPAHRAPSIRVLTPCSLGVLPSMRPTRKRAHPPGSALQLPQHGGFCGPSGLLLPGLTPLQSLEPARPWAIRASLSSGFQGTSAAETYRPGGCVWGTVSRQGVK